MTAKDKENTENEDVQENIEEEIVEESVDEAEVTLSKEEYDALLKKIEELEGIKDRLLRTAADYENAKKRLVKEKEDFLKFASERLISELLPSLDNLNRAIETAEKDNPDDPILKGIHLTEKGVFDVLKRHGLSRVEALNQPFSVEFHEALGQVETSEKEEGTVVEELETGYMLHGKLIRPARVKIAKAPADEEVADDGGEEE
jgi:molecular chaperone GrpE